MNKIILLFLVLTTSFFSHAEQKIALELLSQENKYGVELVFLLRKEMEYLNIFTENKYTADVIAYFSVIEDEIIGANQEGVITSIIWVHKDPALRLPYALNFNVFKCPKEELNGCVDMIQLRNLKAIKVLEGLLSSKQL